jgi:transglutaminase-like putative cysteine protease/predicted glutamine amidotransferase
MPNVLAMSFEGELAPSFDLRCLQPGGKLPDGWGIGYYAGGEPAATVLKEAGPAQRSIRGELVKAWENLASSLFVLHIRVATWGRLSDANTQPFLRTYGGRDWLLAHSGSLRHRLAPAPDARFLPVGSTDTELIFCEILGRIAEAGWQSLGEVPPETLHAWFDAYNEHGSMTTVLTDGRDLCVYADRNDEGSAYVWQLRPPYGTIAFADADLEVDLTRRGIKARKGVIVSSEPMPPTDELPVDWRLLSPGHLLVVRQGAVRAEIRPSRRGEIVVGLSAPIPARPDPLSLPRRQDPRRLEVKHRTVYRYEKPVERSAHVLRLEPAHDWLQRLLEHESRLLIDGVPFDEPQREYEDVFGNRVRRVLVETPFTELAIESASLVETLDADPFRIRPPHERSTIPVVWMPWQRQVLQPFLLPQELAESELQELTEYAMSFAERNDYDLLDTLLDLNRSIFREYAYEQGTTTVLTTAFEVYERRRGVCQDFTNLFICLARLLGVPARYTCGYIYTGPGSARGRQSEASHAWAQVYFAEVGWKGFDPTNGIVTQTDHIRVAVGRNYIDATPTSGTLYVGGGRETLEVAVQVEPAGEPGEPRRAGLGP